MLLTWGEGRDGDGLPPQGTNMNENIPDLGVIQVEYLPSPFFQIAQCLKKISSMSTSEVLQRFGFVTSDAADNLKIRATGGHGVSLVLSYLVLKNRLCHLIHILPIASLSPSLIRHDREGV